MKARRSILTAVTLVACLGVTAGAFAEPSAYLRLKAAKTGEIKGSVTQKGREGSIRVVALDHSIVVPVDAATGQVAGKRQHKPLVITKEVDKSSPLLRQVMNTNEVLTEVTLQFFAQQPSGVEYNHYTITLKNARIVGLHHTMADNRVPENLRITASEEVTLVYESITWTWNDGGLTATDSARMLAP